MRELYSRFKRNMLFYTVLIAVSVTALAVLALIVFKKYDIEELTAYYDRFKVYLTEFENAIASMDSKYVIFIVLMLLFVIKSFVMLYPVTALYIIAGLVFRTRYAVLVNLAGTLLMMTIKYYQGRLFGGGSWGKLATRSDVMTSLIGERGKNMWTLFALRLFPCMPTNGISRVYGSLGCNYIEYSVVSLTGALPRIMMYSVIGNSVLDPLSPQFIVTVAMLISFSMASAWLIRKFFSRVDDGKPAEGR